MSLCVGMDLEHQAAIRLISIRGITVPVPLHIPRHEN